MNIVEDIIGGIILNYLGGFLRFLFGTIYRRMFGMKTYTFKECLNGPPEEGINYISQNNEHRRDNEFIGILFIVFSVLLYLFLF